MPFIIDAYAPDESIGAEIERRIARANVANRLKEIDFITDVLRWLRPAGQNTGPQPS
jgi:hypothetical protein